MKMVDAVEALATDARARAAPPRRASNIGFISRGGPGSSTHDAVADAQQQPGRAAVRVVEHGRAARHHRLAPVDRRHAQPAPREPALDAGDDRRILVHRQAEHVGDDVAGQVVVGGAEAAGQDDEIGALERLAEEGRQIAAAIADDRLGAQRRCRAPASRVGEEQRVGVDPGRAEQLAADRDDLRRAQRRRSALMRTSPEAGRRRRAATRFAYTAAIASSAITPSPPCRRSRRPAGNGLITSKMRNSTNPASAVYSPTGMNASVISIPSTSSITIGPGSMPPK